MSGIGMTVLTVGILFRLIFWNGWQFMMEVGGITVIACGVILLITPSKKVDLSGNPFETDKTPANFGQIFWIPFCFLAVMSAIALIPSEKTLYETFSFQSKDKTYEQFQVEKQTYMNHRHGDTTNSVRH